ncbi:MAG TPA: hypothetical protein VL738_02800 [Dactylosporangium sp.]|jgi:hypothetical protein|nr:hypothetical protein [Dactylosporangium sp.]
MTGLSGAAAAAGDGGVIRVVLAGIASARPPGVVSSWAPRDAGRGTLSEAAVDRRLEARE